MKVIVSGGTGYIGSQVLEYCLSHPSITSVVVLTRREIDKLSGNPKAKVVIVKDFTSYDQATTEEFKSAEAVLWCLGTSYGDERIDIEFPLAFIKAIKSTQSTRLRPFRYVQLSGAFTEPPPKSGEAERPLWFFSQGRRVRGRTEVTVLAEHDPASQFLVYAVKPGGVLPQYVAFFQKWIFGDGLSTTIDELKATMVDLALKGAEQRVFQSRDIMRHGGKLIAQNV